MKINVEFTIKVKNKGEINETSVDVPLSAKFLEVCVAIENAKESLESLQMQYFEKKVKENGRPFSKKEAEKILRNVTFRELCENN